MSEIPDIRLYKCVTGNVWTYYVMDFSRPYSRSMVINYTISQEHKRSNIECLVGETVARIVKGMDQFEANHKSLTYCESTFLELLVVTGITKDQLQEMYKKHVIKNIDFKEE